MDTAFCDDCLRDLVTRLQDPQTKRTERAKLWKEIDTWLDQRNLYTAEESRPISTR